MVALDPRAVALLSNDILVAIKRHYETRPVSRDSVFEALNALGMACGVVLAPAAEHGDAELAEGRAFLNLTTDNHLAEALKALAAETHPGGSSVN